MCVVSIVYLWSDGYHACDPLGFNDGSCFELVWSDESYNTTLSLICSSDLLTCESDEKGKQSYYRNVWNLYIFGRIHVFRIGVLRC